MLRLRYWIVSLLTLVACGGDDSAVSTCTPGMSVGCVCTDGRSGAQVCATDGTFGACVCDGAPMDGGALPDGSGLDAHSPTDAGGADSAAVPTDSGMMRDAGGVEVDIVSIDTDMDTTCVARRDGTVWCWGGDFGTAPTMVAGAAGAIEVGVGDDHYCFVTSSGGVACWGDNSARQCGRNTSGAAIAAPMSVTMFSGAASVAGGYRHTCSLETDRTAACWGDQTWGQLGNGSMSTTSDSSPDDVNGITNALQIEVGPYHGCARLDTGVVACWGRAMGPSGDDVANPVAVTGVTNAVHIAVALANGCAARSDGSVVCWGISFSALSPIPGVSDAVQVANGRTHGCAIRSDGSAVCWGRNFAGQLGDGTMTDSTTAVAVAGLTDAVAITAYDDHNCAVRSTGDVVCWGGNEFGQLGDGTTIDHASPVTVTLP